MTYIPAGTKPDLAADQWRESRVKRTPPGPNAEAWLRANVPQYREAVKSVARSKAGALVNDAI